MMLLDEFLEGSKILTGPIIEGSVILTGPIIEGTVLLTGPIIEGTVLLTGPIIEERYLLPDCSRKIYYKPERDTYDSGGIQEITLQVCMFVM